MSKAERDIKRKLRVLKHYEKQGNVAKICRHFGIRRYYQSLCVAAIKESTGAPASN